jgi:hypothetical protein
LLPEALLPCKIHGTTVLPHFLGEHDHPWLRVLLEEYARFVGRRQRELDERLREPLPTPNHVIRRAEMLIPSSKSSPGGAFLPPPDPQFNNVDHFKCYKVRVTSGTPSFPAGVQATLGDQFTDPPKLFDVLKPRLLCAPADKNGEGIKAPARHLLCYKIRPGAGPPHVGRIGLGVRNQFGNERVNTLKESLLCVPSEKFLL